MIGTAGSMRTLVRSWMPWFAQEGRAGRYVEPIGRGMDRLLQASIDAVRIRYPSVCPSDALTLLGRDRKIPRAPGEPEAYRRRLLLWLDLWALAGLPLGLLYAVQSYLWPGYPMVRMVTRGGYWWTLDEGASASLTPYEAMTLGCDPEPGFSSNPLRYVPALEASPRAAFWAHIADPVNWDYDSISNPGFASNWWDFWLIVYPSNYGLQGQYDTGLLYDTGLCWGLNTTPGTGATLRSLIRTYKRAGSKCRGLLFAPSTTDFDPYSLVSDPGMPDGYWGNDTKSVGGEWVPARRTDVRYVEV